jgi:hypothetical protein
LNKELPDRSSLNCIRPCLLIDFFQCLFEQVVDPSGTTFLWVSFRLAGFV